MLLDDHVLVLINPHAGSVGRRADLHEALLTTPGLQLVTTRDRDEMVEFARSAALAGVPGIAVAGGDGSVSDVALALGEAATQGCSSIPLLVLPGGTGNDLHRALDLPDDGAALVDLLRTGRPRPMDTLSVRRRGPDGRSTHLAVNAVVGGTMSTLDDRLEAEAKSTWGPLAYAAAGVGAMAELEATPVRLRLDGGEAFERQVLGIAVANGRTVAGGVGLAPGAWLDDGQLDLILLCDGPGLRAAADLGRYWTTGQAEEEGLLCRFNAREVEISAGGALPWNADGDPIGEGDLEVRCQPRRLVVYSGPDAALRGE